MSTRKSVKCITINGISGGIVSANPIDGRNTTNGEIAAYGDTLFTTAVSPVLHASDLTIDVLDEGDTYPAIKALVGTTVPVTITTSYGDGSTSPSDTVSLSGDCVILSAEGDSIAVDDYGRSVIHVTLRRQAPDDDDSSNVVSVETTPASNL